jgi:2-C-methyl-D-erythritol 4-phosphate cytidylyltransferase
MTVALIVAAGSGERLGAEAPKAFVPLAGRPMLHWSIEALSGVPEVEQIVVALPPHPVEIGGLGLDVAIETVRGGASRSASVKNALEAAGDDETVLVHDAARPLVTTELARSVIDALRTDPDAAGAIAATPVTDTIKRAGSDRRVRETLDRGELWSVQTPQVFRREALARALACAPELLAAATDDAWLIEREGGRVLVVSSGVENLKVTTALDLRVAELLLRERGPAPERA